MASIRREPFGQADCESELKILKDEYCKIYFDESPFNEAAIDPTTYLLIGRRGSGKTALSQYFSFQRTLVDPVYIDVDEPLVYQHVLSKMSIAASESREVAIPRLRKLWEYVIWCVIFEETKNSSSDIELACIEDCDRNRASKLIASIFERVLTFFDGSDESGFDTKITQLFNEERGSAAKEAVLDISNKRPVIVAIDTLEKYDAGNEPLMHAMAALIQCAASFNLSYADRNIHLKVFMSGEVFPYLKEEVIQNPLKSIKSPVYLLWRPKDLLRLISWRFYRNLLQHDLLHRDSRGEINWEDYHEVMERMWRPYFGSELINSRGLREHTFSYVLRHTQMRPRQLILLCNAIAKTSLREKRFPNFSENDIRIGVKEAESDLASEIINSFSSVYPGVSTIVDALMKMPLLFEGKELDRRASQSASEWPPGAYSPARFRRLVAELGIVGRVRRQNDEAGYIDADFEYALQDRLPLTHRDVCVIHPMFYARLNVEFNTPARVMPFSTEREAREAGGEFT